MNLKPEDLLNKLKKEFNIKSINNAKINVIEAAKQLNAVKYRLKKSNYINVVLPKLTDSYVHLWNVQANETLCGINCPYELEVNNFVTCPECLRKKRYDENGI